jgi:hypothetical protein
VIMNLTSEIKQLSHFSEQEGIAEIVTGLSRLSDSRPFFESIFYSSPEISNTDRQALIDDLRTKLHAILEKAKNNFDIHTHESLATASHNALLALAKLMPKNDEDPVMFTEISSGKQVVIAEGYQYDIDLLIHFQKMRPARKETNEKGSNYKPLIDPRTNVPFLPRDSAYIQRVAAEKGITIPWLVSECAGNPNMIKIAEELQHCIAQKKPDEIAQFLVQFNKNAEIYGDNLASTLERAGPKLQLAKNLLNVKDNLVWRARFILGGCAVPMFGYALESLIAETGTFLDPFSAMIFETGLVVGGGLALYGLMVTPKITSPYLTASDRETIDFLSTLGASPTS